MLIELDTRGTHDDDVSGYGFIANALYQDPMLTPGQRFQMYTMYLIATTKLNMYAHTCNDEVTVDILESFEVELNLAMTNGITYAECETITSGVTGRDAKYIIADLKHASASIRRSGKLYQKWFPQSIQLAVKTDK